MNKITLYFKGAMLILAIIMTSGFSLSSVFAQEYTAVEAVVIDGTSSITQADATDVAVVEPDGPVTPVSGAEHTDIATVDADPIVTPVDHIDASEIDTVDADPIPADNGGGTNNGGGNGSSSGGRSRNSNNGGQVLGAENFQFLTNLSYGMQNSDVMELQKRLRAEGYFVYPTDTGYFGPFTLIAVKLYQIAHFSEIGFVTGFVGPLTRAVLNVM